MSNAQKMGPRQFHKEFIGREEYDKRKGKCLHNLANIEGKLGVDVSGTFHKKLGTVRGASSFDMTPEGIFVQRKKIVKKAKENLVVL